ncbi:MAG: protoporphyrinogen oxidase-like protein [Pseudomonadales bacterium]|nr:protoporphyrinogen oxidase-like protein [Pseudomonadales bacterium]MCP5185596.1 protoporphyrinogen oxidase-like protein [Pseudomonadales bacterium]
MTRETLILGAGMTGLAAGYASGAPVYDMADGPGGICRSYYRLPGNIEATTAAERDAAYRFENGGGHWIFGGDPLIVAFMERMAPMSRYARLSSVYFPDSRTYVPYPLQNNLRYLPEAVRIAALTEMTRTDRPPVATMAEWLEASFGHTLGELFFKPFHELYTAGLFDRIAPQDGYKSPVDVRNVLTGAISTADAVGYNTTFLYPRDGLDHLALKMAQHCKVQYGKQVTGIDRKARAVQFSDGSEAGYERLISTLPLHHTLQLAGLTVAEPADPHTAVLVLNIGARKGPACPPDHWLYIPACRSGFHRVGFYSNVTTSFLPAASRAQADAVSIYVERGFPAGSRPDAEATAAYAREVVEELQEWGYITDAEVVDPTWIDVAYTWSWPGSTWRGSAMKALEAEGIYPTGRYARWIFQGIADSLRDGFIAGNALAGG